jgi:hypothetical protein
MKIFILILGGLLVAGVGDERTIPYSQNSTEADLADQVGDGEIVRDALSVLPPMNPDGCHCVVMLPAPKALKATRAVGVIEVKPYQTFIDCGRGITKREVDCMNLGTLREYEIVWDYQGAEAVEVRVNGPAGDIFAASPVKSWMAPTSWAKAGTFFYLQDVSGGKPLVRENTIAVAVVRP